MAWVLRFEKSCFCIFQTLHYDRKVLPHCILNLNQPGHSAMLRNRSLATEQIHESRKSTKQPKQLTHNLSTFCKQYGIYFWANITTKVTSFCTISTCEFKTGHSDNYAHPLSRVDISIVIWLFFWYKIC